MKILFYLGHPAHWHNVSAMCKKLKKNDHEILLVAREKDVLFDLLEGLDYNVKYIKSNKTDSKWSLIWTVFVREIRMLFISLKFKPDLLVGTDIVITHIAKLLGKKSIVLNEDDSAEVPLLAKLGFPYANSVLVPDSCNISPYEGNGTFYPGYHELAYLHPDHFQPRKEVVSELTKHGDTYFLLRFSSLDAHHDDGKKGISDTLALTIVNLLSEQGTVYITSERPLPANLDQYRISIDPKDIHHAIYYASMYIGDSQTMAAEAAILGTPAIRYNDFVGKLGYLEELEHRFELTYGIPVGDEERLLNKVKELLDFDEIGKIWQKRQQAMLEEFINVSEFFYWYMTEFPASKDQWKTKREELVNKFKGRKDYIEK